MVSVGVGGREVSRFITDVISKEGERVWNAFIRELVKSIILIIYIGRTVG